ncbi:MAG: alpha/beta hydrolase [Deltaproteobacteria bacterium]|nr:MAG: alpha/beta hydrolase [Deltaproteobacteria bacterium]
MSSLHFLQKGTGPVLIFIHNGGGFHQIWEKQIDQLSTRYTCLAIDLEGFGKSPDPLEEPTLEYHEKCLSKFIEEQNLNSYVLIGNCIGSSIALLHTLKNPDKVKSLILFNICPGIRIYETPLARFLHKKLILSDLLKDLIGGFIVKAMGGRRERKRLPALLFGKDPDENSDLFKKFKEVYQTDKQKKSRLLLLQNIESFTTENYFKAKLLKTPTLLFWGDHNKIVDLKEGVRLKNLLKPESFCVLENAGHMAMYENADEVNEKIENFLAKHIS